jgi:putative inorganic carbon (HCO3(-)) transporter
VIARAVAWYRRWYFAVALSFFIFSPEVRRIVDWQTSVHKLSLFSALPLLGLLPALLLLAEWKDVGSFYRLVATIWVGAFGVALFIGGAAGSPLAAAYDMLEFSTPLLFGLFLASAHDDLYVLFNRVAGTMLCFAVISDAYAIYQYISPPPWDDFWVVNSGLASTGTPEPFGLRAFGTLNSYATLAHYTALTMVVNLPRLRMANWRSVIGYVPMVIALLITSDRTAWLAVTAGSTLYLVMSPRRKDALKALGLVALLCTALSVALLLSLTGSQEGASLLQSRIASLGEIGDDTSFADRQRQTSDAWHEGITEPLGQGLGSIGAAANAGASGSTNTLDNGYLARFVELGVVGCAAYLVALVLALVAIFRGYLVSLRADDTLLCSILAGSFAVQVTMLGTDLSTDTHGGLLAIMFWFSLYVASQYLTHASQAEAKTPGTAFKRPIARTFGARG